MKIKDGFILREVAGSFVVVAVGKRAGEFNGVINLNQTSAFMWRMLEKGATSFWETINGDADFGNAGSLCHGWSAMPIYYLNRLL